jgi:hypothetical protein
VEASNHIERNPNDGWLYRSRLTRQFLRRSLGPGIRAEVCRRQYLSALDPQLSVPCTNPCIRYIRAVRYVFEVDQETDRQTPFTTASTRRMEQPPRKGTYYSRKSNPCGNCKFRTTTGRCHTCPTDHSFMLHLANRQDCHGPGRLQ